VEDFLCDLHELLNVASLIGRWGGSGRGVAEVEWYLFCDFFFDSPENFPFFGLRLQGRSILRRICSGGRLCSYVMNPFFHGVVGPARSSFFMRLSSSMSAMRCLRWTGCLLISRFADLTVRPVFVVPEPRPKAIPGRGFRGSQMSVFLCGVARRSMVNWSFWNSWRIAFLTSKRRCAAKSSGAVDASFLNSLRSGCLLIIYWFVQAAVFSSIRVFGFGRHVVFLVCYWLE